MNAFWQFAIVAAGGAFGAMSRYGFVRLVQRFEPEEGQLAFGIPLATLLANLVGCFLIGILLGTDFGDKHEAVKLGVGVGFLGALTTFSTFSAETIEQLQNGQSWTAMIYVSLSLMLGFGLVVAGMAVAKKVF